MADANDSVPPPSPRPRRSSFAGDTFASLFGPKRSNSMTKPVSTSSDSSPASQPTQQYPGPITTAAAQAQRRRLSLTTLGLSGSPNQTSTPFNPSYRRESSGSAQSGSIDESAIEDDYAAGPGPTPFGRRMSFGARALRDVRSSSSGAGGGGGASAGDPNGTLKPTTTTTTTSTSAESNTTGHISSRSSGDAKGREGFNWSDNLRTRAERSSIAAASSSSPTTPGMHSRAKSVAIMEPPVREIPKVAKEQIRPDHFQERILKGDFYMD